MKHAARIMLATLLLAGCESTPEPYPVSSQPYVIPAPAIPAPEPRQYDPLPPAPVLAPPTDPQPVSPEIAEPVPPAAEPDPPRDPVEDVLLKPVLPSDDAQTRKPVPAAAPQSAPPSPDTGNAVPLMGFRPMRGQKQPGA